MKRFIFLIFFCTACAHQSPQAVAPQLPAALPRLALDRDSAQALYDTGPEPQSALTKLWQEFQLTFRTKESLEGFGPVWYRGRLQAQSVQVLVVGKANSPTELVLRRAFADYHGQKLQNILRRWGINKSYLFINIWPWLSTQRSDKELIAWQKRFLSQVIANNSNTLSVILAVGPDAKAAFSALLEDHGINCPNERNLELCDNGSLDKALQTKKKLLLLGVTAPQALDASFQAGLSIADTRVKDFSRQNPSWLTPDASLEQYQTLPRVDFPFHPPLSQTEQIFISRKNQILIPLTKKQVPASQPKLLGSSYDPIVPIPELRRDLSASSLALDAYDSGPCSKGTACVLAQLLEQTNTLYRGSYQDAKTLVLTDHRSADDFLSGRVLVGKLGQKLQSFLKAAQRDKNYFMMSCPQGPRKEKLLQKTLWEIFPFKKPETLLVLGSCKAFSPEIDWAKDVTLLTLPLPLNADYVKDWNQILQNWVPQKNIYANGFRDVDSSIPRADLPFGWPWWFGSAGDHAQWAESYIALLLPPWLAHE